MRLMLFIVSMILPTAAWAEEAHGYSRGNAFIYFTFIAAILIYGVHDVFRNARLTLVSAAVILGGLYFLLPGT